MRVTTILVSLAFIASASAQPQIVGAFRKKTFAALPQVFAPLVMTASSLSGPRLQLTELECRLSRVHLLVVSICFSATAARGQSPERVAGRTRFRRHKMQKSDGRALPGHLSYPRPTSARSKPLWRSTLTMTFALSKSLARVLCQSECTPHLRTSSRRATSRCRRSELGGRLRKKASGFIDRHV